MSEVLNNSRLRWKICVTLAVVTGVCLLWATAALGHVGGKPAVTQGICQADGTLSAYTVADSFSNFGSGTHTIYQHIHFNVGAPIDRPITFSGPSYTLVPPYTTFTPPAGATSGSVWFDWLQPDGGGHTQTTTFTVPQCQQPKPPTVTAQAQGCVNSGAANGVVTGHISNPNNLADQAKVTLGTKTTTVNVSALGSASFSLSGFAPGTYSGSVKLVLAGTSAPLNVTVATCSPPPPPPPPPPTCAPGQTGTPPNCVMPPTPTCPAGTTGTPPNCQPPAPPHKPPVQKCVAAPLHGTITASGSGIGNDHGPVTITVKGSKGVKSIHLALRFVTKLKGVTHHGTWSGHTYKGRFASKTVDVRTSGFWGTTFLYGVNVGPWGDYQFVATLHGLCGQRQVLLPTKVHNNDPPHHHRLVVSI